MSKFAEQILRFNTMYKLNGGVGFATIESNQIFDRLRNFQDILSEEMDEAEALEVLINAANAGETDVDFERDAAVFEIIKKIRKDHPDASLSQIFAVANADWLGDIIVYCASEMMRYGLDIDKVLNAIMESNFSKLGADGKPIYDSRNKVMKGPSYVPPEGMLFQSLFGSTVGN